MKKFNIKTIIASLILNMSVMLFIGLDVNNITESKAANIEQEQREILCSYEEQVNGKIIIDFSDGSYAIVNHKTNDYIFQPVCLGDWDITVNNMDDLQAVIETYYKDCNIKILSSTVSQSLEN